MTGRESSGEIEAAAAEWVARLDRDPADASLQSELEHWLAADDRRKGAYIRAQAAWRLLDRARALAAPEIAPPRAAVRPRVANRRYFLGGAAAAAAFGMVAVGLSQRRESRQVLQTRQGEQRVVAMNDGSTAALDTATSMEVRYRNSLRLIELHKGEAWFKVAKDADRPFVIDAGSIHAKAVGTAFSVGRDGEVVRVLVTEGIVEVGSPNDDFPAQHLNAGMQASLGPGRTLRIEALPGEAMNRLLAWREQKIALNGETVREASDAFNRYNDVKIVLDDPTLADEKVVGWFNSNDPEGFARALEVSFGARTERVGDTLRLSLAEK